MSKGTAALTYLPKVEIVVAAGSNFAVESLKGALAMVAQMQEEETADGTYTNVKCKANDPYSSSLWTIVVAAGNIAGDYQLTFVSEVVNTVSTIGRPALAARRAVDIGIAATTNTFSVRSALALVNFIEKIEDQVAQTGSGAAGDATYTDVALKGNTPFETFNWTLTKLADVYTVTATATS